MDQVQYDAVIDAYARECIALDPDDPKQFSWEVRDDRVSLDDARMFSESYKSGRYDMSMGSVWSPGQNLDFEIDSAVDYDICVRIDVLTKERV